MGRTNATYRDLLRALQERWETYRRGLRREDQAHFDQLFTHARNYADASGLQNHEDPVVPVLFSIALAQEKHLAALEKRVERLEGRLERLQEPSETLADRVESLETVVEGDGEGDTPETPVTSDPADVAAPTDATGPEEAR